MSAATLLVELLCEELPPKALARLGEAFARGVYQGLKKREMLAQGSAMRAFATPRRLAVEVTHVLRAAEPRDVELKLMPVSVALDASGRPTNALLKKLEALAMGGADPATFIRRVDGKAETLFAKSVTPAVALAAALQAALEEAISELPVPKMMSYQLADGRTTVQFVRPVHGLIALHGRDVVGVRVLGMEAGRETQGHRFQGEARLAIDDADGYSALLEARGGVIAEFGARMTRIRQQVTRAASDLGLSLGPEGGVDPLLEEVAALVEMPAVYAGTFESEFLAVPAECLILTMRQNQKYFPLFDANGKLSNRFLIVSNMRLEDPSTIVHGNERVVRPRLADARFFFETDKKTKLAARVPQLATMVHHNKLGTQLDRVERLVSLAMKIQEGLPRGKGGVEWAVQSARLAKADLATLMVGEFPELQGVMGRYYAEADGEPPSVCRAIEQHYWPRFAGDALPTGDASIAVALADRLDLLVGMFSIGQVPTGDKDPFGLRRAALGVVRILMETTPALNAELSALLAAAATVLRIPAERKAQVTGATREFVRERLANLMKERGYTANEVAAVLSVDSIEAKPDRLDLIPRKLEAVREFSKLPEAGSLAAANKRIGNILRQAHEKGERLGFPDGHAFAEKLESDLDAALKRASSAAGPLFEKGDYTGYLKSFAVLKQPVDAFFDGIMVMAEDKIIRQRRLSLLYAMEYEMNRVADIARLAS